MWPQILAALALNTGKNILTGQDPLKNAGQAALLSQFGGGLTDNVIPGAEIPAGVSEAIPGSIESAGMTNVGGTFYNPDYYVGESLGSPIYTGGQGLLSNATDELKSKLGNLTPENLSGLASLLGQEQPDTSAYRQSAGTGGGASRGNLGKSQPLSNVTVNRRKMNIWS